MLKLNISGVDTADRTGVSERYQQAAKWAYRWPGFLAGSYMWHSFLDKASCMR